MNHVQIGLFIVSVFSILSCGIWAYSFLDKNFDSKVNKSLFLGESLLLGGIIMVGEFLLLSMFGLYSWLFLWGAVFINYFFLLSGNVRRGFLELMPTRRHIDLWRGLFIILVLIFLFRNLYFMVDVDSLSVYLYTQKVWLANHSSLVGDATYHAGVFAPQFDTILSSLGLSLYGQETLFPQLINSFWRVITLLLVFGYTTYRFNSLYGLAASIFVALNDHFFFSGVNKWVLINGAIIAFLFAAAYNFWESRTKECSIRFILALVFAVHIFANKYQAAIIFCLLLVLGLLIQPKLFEFMKEIFRKRRYMLFLICAVFFVSLWYLKNLIVTGIPCFPLLAGKFNSFGWTSEQSYVFMKVVGGISLELFLKYMTYLFIWPGINAMKIVIITVCFFPPLLLIAYIRKVENRVQLLELLYWLSLCIFAIMGTALACHWEPRYYRYPIAIVAFTCVISIHFILTSVGIRNRLIIGIVVAIIALKGAFNEGYKIILDQGGFFQRPSVRENIDVALDRIHTSYALRKVCPQADSIFQALRDQDDKISTCAWDFASYSSMLFFLKIRPVVSPWHSTTITWDSLGSEDLIVYDLKAHGIEWIMQIDDGALKIIPIKDYAQQLVKFNKRPVSKYGDYGMPRELSEVVW